MSVAGVLHDGAHVGEVQVDEGRHIDQGGDGLDALTQHVISGLEGVHQGDLLLTDHLQALVGDDDEAVHVHQQICDALLSQTHLPLASKEKGLVTMPTVRMPRSCATSATTGAAPVPVPPPIPAVMKTIWELQSVCDLILALLGSALADLGVGTCARPW